MRILFFGDVVGQPGRLAIKKILPSLKEKCVPDLILANGENLAHGQGISEKSVKEILEAGIDFLTNGDHAFALSEGAKLLENNRCPILRPLNWPGGVPGRGITEITAGIHCVLLVNLVGRVFMKQDFDDPFQKLKEVLENYSLKGKEEGTIAIDAIIVDFHAEATSEKAALAALFDGKISALLGTHTHVPTADQKILASGTAFISDVGMVGPRDSVLGCKKETVIKRFLTQRLYRLEVALGRDIEIDAVLLDIDEGTGLAKNIKGIRETVVLD